MLRSKMVIPPRAKHERLCVLREVTGILKGISPFTLCALGDYLLEQVGHIHSDGQRQLAGADRYRPPQVALDWRRRLCRTYPSPAADIVREADGCTSPSVTPEAAASPWACPVRP